jgi:hypothetical protein
MIGTTVGPYRVIGTLGEGGMGRVFDNVSEERPDGDLLYCAVCRRHTIPHDAIDAGDCPCHALAGGDELAGGLARR